MALSEQDREWVRLTARELVFEVSRQVLTEHVKACPHGRALMKGKAFLAGVGFAIAAASGAAGTALGLMLGG